MEEIIIIGGGLAGSEAALYLANKGVKVKLYEMRPKNFTPVHKTKNLAELVCSNTFGSMEITSGQGLLKKELEILGSPLLKIAKECFLEAGSALCVDRNAFSEKVTKMIESNENIELIREEIFDIPKDNIVIVASGPLTSEKLSKSIQNLIGSDGLFFFDAIAPIVEADTVDYSKGFWGSRYQKGDDYFNCIMTKEEYEIFYKELINAELQDIKDFEKGIFFEGCLPIEEIGKRGEKTLLFGPLSPKGLKNYFKEKKDVVAIVQLRKENKEGTLLSLVGFQTRLKYKEQKRVFSLIPCLKNANFVRLGSMHKNTYIESNKYLTEFLNLKNFNNIFFAGQITGAEGYSSALATGLFAAINAYKLLNKEPLIKAPYESMLGSLIRYITTKEGKLQPMNPVFGLLPPLTELPNSKEKIKNKKEKKEMLAKRALEAIEQWKNLV